MYREKKINLTKKTDGRVMKTIVMKNLYNRALKPKSILFMLL